MAYCFHLPPDFITNANKILKRLVFVEVGSLRSWWDKLEQSEGLTLRIEGLPITRDDGYTDQTPYRGRRPQ
eukprot:8586351-Pyramimonas_sp.AAC.1